MPTPDFPETLAVEIHGYCNATCSYCPYSKISRSQNFMRMDLFKRLMNEIREHGVDSMRLSHLSETLLFKEAIPYIAETKGLPVYINTNMTKCDSEMLKKLEEVGFTGKLRCHVQEDMGVDYKAQVKNYETALERWGKERIELVEVLNPKPWAGEAPFRKAAYCQVNRMNRDMVIAWNGLVMQCCVADKGNVGDVSEMTIAEAWRGLEYERAREELRAGANDLCNRCDCGWQLSRRNRDGRTSNQGRKVQKRQV